MNIAVNTRLLLKNKLEGIGWFTFHTISRIVKNNPQHTFYFIFDRPYDKMFIFADNVVPIVVSPPSRHPFLWYLWFEWSIPRVLKKIKADVFLSTDGYLSLSSKVPCVMVLHDIYLIHKPKDAPFFTRKYYQYFIPKFIKKASRIAVVSNFTKSDIIKKYQCENKEIDIIYNASNSIYTSVNDNDKITTKNEYSNGKPYFVFVGALHPRKNVENLLLAFDDFCKKTRAEINLIIVGKKMFMTESIDLVYNKMQFKDRVIFTGHLSVEKLHYIMASALALTFVPYFEGFGIPIVEAMSCGVPVICSNTSAMPEVSGGAAILVSPNNYVEISEAMINLHKNENLRNKLIEKGFERAKYFSWDKSAILLWESIKKVT